MAESGGMAEGSVRLTTHAPSGDAVTTEVWMVRLGDGRVACVCPAGSGVGERVDADPRVSVSATGSAAAESGRARVVRSGRLFDEAHGRVGHQHRWRLLVDEVLRAARSRRRGASREDDVVVVVDPPPQAKSA